MISQKTFEPVVCQGHFDEFTIEQSDRRGIVIYRAGLLISALSFIAGSILVLWQGATPFVLKTLNYLFVTFSLGLIISAIFIRIYLILLHRLLKIFWFLGTAGAIILIWQNPEPLAWLIYNDSLAFFIIALVFATLTGIYLKEVFCYQQFETILLFILVPTLFVGHAQARFSLSVEKILLASWAVLYLIFVLRKMVQPLEPDIGDKSIFVYLEQQRASKSESPD